MDAQDSPAHEGETRFDIELDEETWAHYEVRAQAAGRTIEAQIRYELEVNHGLCPPDPGDLEATQRAEIYRRMHKGHPLNG